MLVLVFPVSATQFLCHTGGGDETYPVREIQLHADGAQLFKMMMMVVSVVIQSVRYTLFAQSLRMCHYRWLNILNQLVSLDRNDSLQYRSLFSPWVSDSQMIGHRRSSSNKNGGRCESSHHHPYAAGFLLAGRRDSSHLSRL